MSRAVEHYSAWKSEPVVCERCAWRGLGFELKQGELYRESYEENCPHCGETLLIVALPTVEEAGEHRSEMSPLERELFEKAEAVHSKLQLAMLRDPSQLPEIAGAGEVILEWDMNWNVSDPFARTLRIKHGDRVLWEEPALYECYEHFVDVAVILKAKYGARLIDLVPAENSKIYLWGDRLSAPSVTDAARRWLRTGDRHDLPWPWCEKDAPP